MRGVRFSSRVALAVAVLFGILLAGGCQSTVATDQVVAAADTEVTAPEGVLRAQEAVLRFLRDGANECVPPGVATWTVEADAQPPAGYAVYRFRSTGCTMTITEPQYPDGAMLYHVALGDGPTGFCWQAVVNETGEILLTGNAAQTDPTLGNPAETYCEQQGYEFVVVERELGGACGMCVFPDGRMCNAWAFFHAACGPENAPDAVGPMP